MSRHTKALICLVLSFIALYLSATAVYFGLPSFAIANAVVSGTLLYLSVCIVLP